MSKNKEEGKKVVRVNAGLPEDEHAKLERLAFAAGLPKTNLATELITLCLNNPGVIDFIQKEHKTPSLRKVTPIIDKGKLIY